MSDRFIAVGLGAAFLALVSIVVMVGQLGVRAMDSLHADARSIAQKQWKDVQLADEALSLSTRNSQLNIEIFVADDRAKIESLLKRRAEGSARVSALLAILETRVGSPEEQRRLDAILLARSAYLESYQRATKVLVEQQRTDEARRILTQETFPLVLTYHAAFRAFAQFQTDEMNEELDRSAARYASARTRAIDLQVLSILLAAVIAAVVVKKIMGEILRRKAAENKIRRMNEDLELTVLQRTAALEKANFDLSNEIAERKRTEELVRRLSTAVEQCPVSIIITDLFGCITYANRRFFECTGYRYDEVIGQNPRLLKSGRTPPEDYKRLWEAITAGDEWRGELCNRKKNGDLYWEFAVIRPIRDEAGKIAHFLAVKEDITERRSMEAHLQQAQKLEAIGQLAAGIAHEINTPIQFIGDNTRFVQKAWASLDECLALVCPAPPSTLDESTLRKVVERLVAADITYLQTEVPSAIQQSLEGIERVSQIVRAMKEFSHPGLEETQVADINRAIETTVIVTRNVWKHVCELETLLSDEVGLVKCYVGELNQAILNLIVNAAQAIAAVAGNRPGGKGKITIQTAREQHWVQISVHDTGCGIPLAIQSRIFDPFFTTKEPGKGTGQGLALAHAIIVKKHGGNIWFESEPGEGTTFFVRLPADPASADVDREPKRASAAAASSHATTSG